MMPKLILIALAAFSFQSAGAAAQVAVHVEPAHLDGPRELAPQTEQGVIRDYLDSWKTMRAAFSQNADGLLAKDFTGTAKERLSDSIHQQLAAGIHTRYEDRSHDIQIAFYSPEGLSIQLTDTVDYDVQIFDRDKQISTQTVHARYVVIMTPAEVRWRVRVMQTLPE
jgi:hypothetical protein